MDFSVSLIRREVNTAGTTTTASDCGNWTYSCLPHEHQVQRTLRDAHEALQSNNNESDDEISLSANSYTEIPQEWAEALARYNPHTRSRRPQKLNLMKERKR